ncbi:MAG: hypothetical protein QW417_01945 [Zestosphaera sp.]
MSRQSDDETLWSQEVHLLQPSRHLNPSLIDFIDHLQSFEYVPEISEVADLMDLHTSTVWKMMKTLKQRGLELQGLIDVSRLGMVEVVLIFDKFLEISELPKCLLREYAPVLPWGSYLRYVVPRNAVETFLTSLYVKLGVEAREVYVLPTTIYSKPSLKDYYDITTRRLLLSWDKLLARIKSSPRESLPRESPGEKIRYDEIDLHIVRELELNPFTSIKNIAKKLSDESSMGRTLNYVLVLRHYNNHVKNRGVMRGVRLRFERLLLDPPIKTLSIVAGNPIDLLRVSKILSTHVYFLDSYISLSDNILITQALIPPRLIFDLSLFFEKLKSSEITKSWRNLYLDNTRLKKYTFPVKLYTLTIEEMLSLSDDELMIKEMT